MDDDADYYNDYVERVVEDHARIVEYLLENAPRLAERKRKSGSGEVEENGVFLWNVWYDDDNKLMSYLRAISYPMSAEVHVNDEGTILQVDVKRNNHVPGLTEAIYSFADGVVTGKEFPKY